MSNGTKVMLEMKNSEGNWPTEKLLEDPDFRLFEVIFVSLLIYEYQYQFQDNTYFL